MGQVVAQQEQQVITPFGQHETAEQLVDSAMGRSRIFSKMFVQIHKSQAGSSNRKGRIAKFDPYGKPGHSDQKQCSGRLVMKAVQFVIGNKSIARSHLC